jgi:Spy/CpxP family protein refolding chaperone
MNRTLKLSFLCGGIFLAGVVAGGFAARHMPRPGFGGQPKSEGFGPQQLRRLTEGLDLTQAQRDAIRPIIQKTGDELRTLRKDSIAQATRVVEAMDAAVALQLTPAQRERLAVLRAEERSRMKALMEERQRRREGEEYRRPPKPGDPSSPASPPPPEPPAGPAR